MHVKFKNLSPIVNRQPLSRDTTIHPIASELSRTIIPFCMLAKPIAQPQPESDLNRARAIQRCAKFHELSQTFGKWSAYAFLISIGVGVLALIYSGGRPARAGLEVNVVMLLSMGITFLFLGLTCAFRLLRLGVILFCLGKFTLSYLFYNQLLLAATVSLFMTLDGLVLIIPFVMLMGWFAMLYAYVHEADPTVTRGNQPYFVAKRVAEARMKRRAEEKLKREQTTGKPA